MEELAQLADSVVIGLWNLLIGYGANDRRWQ